MKGKTDNGDEETHTKSTDGKKKEINLSPNGLIGVLFIIVFFLVAFMYFGLIIQTGEFNPKIIAPTDKMPLGKEY